LIERSYKNDLRVYRHEEVTLNFPKELHELLRVFSEKKLEITGYKEGNKVHIILGAKEEQARKVQL
jgi:hypothetical protein